MLSTLRSRATNIFKDAFNAFYEFSFPKGVRWYRINQEIKIPRYPAPASEPTDQMYRSETEYDYRTSYRDSHYNIRYEGPHPNLETKLFIHVSNLNQEALGESVEEKLVRLGYIKRSDNKVTLKLESAKEEYLKRTGKKADQPNCKFLILGMVDEYGITEQPVEKGDRESMAQLVRQQFLANKEQNQLDDMQNDLNEYYNQKMKTFMGWGIADNDPVYQQLILDIEYHLEQYIRQEKNVGKMPFFKGDPQFWNILDNSHEPKNVQIAQIIVKDLATNLDIATLEKMHNQQEHRKFEEKIYPYNKNQTY